MIYDLEQLYDLLDVDVDDGLRWYERPEVMQKRLQQVTQGLEDHKKMVCVSFSEQFICRVRVRIHSSCI